MVQCYDKAEYSIVADLSFVVWHVILLEAVIKICICYSYKGHIPLIQGSVDS